MSQDIDSTEDLDLAEWETLTEAEQDERMRDEICGQPLESLLDVLSEPQARRDFLGTYGMLKVGTAATEVLQSDELIDAADRAELALILLEIVTVAAKNAGAHRHKLASGLRGLARSLGS